MTDEKAKVALITGITGQDGSYLTELLLEKGYEVHGIIRRSSSFNTGRVDHIFQDPHESHRRLTLHYGDIADASNLSRLIESVQPDEIYNLAAQSHVRVSFDIPEYTGDVTGLGTLRLLDAIRESGVKTKFYQASSSEMFGLVQEVPQRETTPFYPRSPYGVAKVYSYWITRNYRESYGLFACNGILFNHESPRRGKTFVTRKITRGMVRIKLGLDQVLYLGNLDARRDWGYAKDYVEGMWRMLQQAEPDDYVLATNETHTVREFVERTAKRLGMQIEWRGSGIDEEGVDVRSGRVVVKIDPSYFRPAEVDLLIGDYTKARTQLGWEPKVAFRELVDLMVDADLKAEGGRQPIKLIKSSFYHEAETKQALADFIMDEEILSMNKECQKFEQAFAAKQQRKHAVYVGNGSVANLLLVQAMLNQGTLKRGDKVGFSALTWPTNVMPLIQLGLVPVPLDCDLRTLNVSPAELEKRIGGLKGLFLTNVLGFCDDLPRLRDMCERNGVVLIEDNCESLGSRVNGRLLGNYGLASTFSFFVGHHMSTIEGGMVCTDDDALHDQLVMARAHGWDRNLSKDAQDKLRSENGLDAFYARYSFYEIASNFRPTEINGFIGNRQLPYWDEIVAKRARNFQRFHDTLRQNPDFYAYDLSHMDTVSNFAMPVICKTPALAQTYRARFEAAQVEIRPVIAGNVTKQPFYKDNVAETFDCPNSDLVHDNGFYFGNNPEMTDDEIDVLCGLLARS